MTGNATQPQFRSPRPSRQTSRSSTPGTADPPHRVLTQRDLAILKWLKDVGAATIDQLRRRFSLGRSQAYRRTNAMQQHGLLQRHSVLAGHPPLYAPPDKTIGPAGFVHTAAVTDLIVDLELDGRDVLAEIEIRRHRHGRGRLEERLALEQIRTVESCNRVPDVVEIRGEDLVAYEIELSSKGRARRDQILSIYATSGYSRVEWIVPEVQLRALLSSEIAQMGLEKFMVVRAELGRVGAGEGFGR